MSYPYSVFSIDGRHKGQILRTGIVSNPVSIMDQAKKGEGVVPVEVDAATQWVSEGKIKNRPELEYPHQMQAAVGSEYTFEVAIGSKVRIPPAKWAVSDDGVVSVYPDEEGRITVEVRPPWPYREYSVVIECRSP